MPNDSRAATIAFVADEVARRFDAVPMRTEDRLNDAYLQRVIRETVTAVLAEVVLPPRRAQRNHPAKNAKK